MCLYLMKIYTKLWVLWLIQTTPILVESQLNHGNANKKHITNIGVHFKI
jgi:hypothetical protein